MACPVLCDLPGEVPGLTRQLLGEWNSYEEGVREGQSLVAEGHTPGSVCRLCGVPLVSVDNSVLGEGVRGEGH